MTAIAEAPAFTAAKRGDLVVVHRHERDFVIGEPMREYERYELGIVTGISRDGLVKRYLSSWGSEHIMRPGGRETFLIVGKDTVDVTGAYEAGRAHFWPGHHGQPKPFDSLDEVRDVVRPFRK